MTDEQKQFSEEATSGKIGDMLKFLTSEIGKRGEQAYCTVNNGFLVHGRRLIPSPENRISTRTSNRCLDFGVDEMIGMLEWLGREVGKNYSQAPYTGVQLVVGTISAPRGGCLRGPTGRRGHLSHTSGQDVDVGFLTAKPGRPSPLQFHRDFDAATNWWMIKQIFKNPFACIKVIFLDRRHIKALEKVAKKDSDWDKYRRFIRHMPGHKNHLHVRIGKNAGVPGCVIDAKPEAETEEDDELIDASLFLDELKSRQSSSIQK